MPQQSRDDESHLARIESAIGCIGQTQAALADSTRARKIPDERTEEFLASKSDSAHRLIESQRETSKMKGKLNRLTSEQKHAFQPG